jgi:hypothetical protein
MAEQDGETPEVLVSPSVSPAEEVVVEGRRLSANGKPIGQPRKKDIAAKTPGKLAKRGRPPGEAAAMAEFKARLMNSPKSRKVIDSIINAALDDDHKNQSAAWKIIADRLLPLSSFEDSLKSGKSAITINISGIGQGVEIAGTEQDIEDAEYEEVYPKGEVSPAGEVEGD